MLNSPPDYKSTYFLPGNSNVWRGFYLRELSMHMPSEFQKRGSVARTTIAAHNVIIDNEGVTGDFNGTYLVRLNEGDMSGWTFSLDSVLVQLQAGQLMQAKFKGQVVVPLADDSTPFNYTASMDHTNNYFFQVEMAEDIDFNLWQAGDVKIYEGSSLEVEITNGKFRPRAVLHGQMNIRAKFAESDEAARGVALAEIGFENLTIQTIKPYISVSNFSFGSEALQQKMAQFPIGINNIGLRQISDTETSLDFDLLLNLTGNDNGSFAATTGLSLISRIEYIQGRQRWKPKTIEVRNIMLDIDGGAYKFKGSLTFYKSDPVYGKGFNGLLDAEFEPGIKVKASAIFGNVEGMRYWYADALASFPSGIPIFTGVAMYGFGGGAYYRMKMDTQGIGSELGKTVSGVVYVPEATSGLGLKATVVMGSSPKQDAFNGDLTFEIAFFKGGGIRYISLQGNAFFVTPALEGVGDKLKASTQKMVDATKKVEAAAGGAGGALLNAVGANDNTISEIHGEIGSAAGNRGQISAKMFIEYDFENRVLHGNFECYVNVAGGIIQGSGTGGRAGWAVMHFASHEWYIYIGTPDDRLGLSMGIGPVKVNSGSYFMMGSKIPGSPPPPAEVSAILGGVDLDYMKDLNEIGQGRGVAFGANFSMDTGNITFLMFYARFAAGAGFDIMIKDYGDARCEGSSDPIGINGWYANGQAYAYLQGDIGIQVTVFKKNKKVEILNIAAAVVLQAQLPNPFWMKGIVGGHFSVLNGLVKGNCRFEVTIGNKCTIEKNQTQENLLADVKVIADFTPAQSEKDVNVFNTPQVVFTIPVERNFELVDDNGTQHAFRIKLDYFHVLNNNVPLQGMIQWNEAHDVVAFNSFEVLPPKKELKARVRILFEENRNGTWVAATDNGQAVAETAEVTFITGAAPDYIPISNVEYSYPVMNQLNFYKDERNEGYIKLKRGQGYLFEPGPEWRQAGRFTTVSGTKTECNFSYVNQTINFTIPTASLSTNTVYTFELVNIPRTTASSLIDRNVKESSKVVASTEPSVNVEIKQRDAEGIIEELQEKALFTSYFRASKYNSFLTKLTNMTMNSGRWFVANNMVQMIFWYNEERFDKFETGSFNGNASLINFEAELSNTTWYTNIVQPLVYADYPIDGTLSFSHRTPIVLGVPPVKAIHFYRQSTNELVDRTATDFGLTEGPSTIYNLPLVMSEDFFNLRTIAAELSVSSSSPRINKILMASFPTMVSSGTYQIKARYVLPGINKITSEKLITIVYVQ